MRDQSKEVFNNLFHPESIAVIGASNDPLKPGGKVFKNIKENGYKGNLWAVNPNSKSIMDLPVFESIDKLPGPPDLALIAIPAPFVCSALEDLARKGTKAVMILTAGFGEKDEKGKEEEKRFLEIARDASMTLIGPNCSGFMTTSYVGKFAGIIPTVKKGAIDFISGSGATVDYLMEQAAKRGLSFSNVVNLGNSIQLGVEDILGMVDENHGPDSAPIIMLYMELVKDPAKLLYHARSLAGKGCSLIGIKSGVTEAGERAASSHTGAMATSDTAVQAMFDKAGIIRVKSKTELVDVACVLSAAKGSIKGNRACIVTDAGGPGVMLSDELNRQGLELPLLNENTKKRLREILPPESPVTNPIDCLPSRNAEQIQAIFKVLEDEEKQNIDVIIVITGHSGMTDNWGTYQEIMRAMDELTIPVIPVFSSITTCSELLKKVKDSGKIYFFDEVPIGSALGKITKRPIIYEPQMEIEGYDKNRIRGILGSCEGLFAPETVKDILNAAGFKIPLQIDVFSRDKLVSACRDVGFPLVMKVIGPLHKSDSGGVRIGINSIEEADQTWSELLKIEKATGVLIQEMVSGIEVILGALEEEGFGHMIMFGLGGIYTEVLKDISFELAPLAKEESLRMIQKIKALLMLKGVRGEKGISLDLISEYLIRLSLLVTDFPQIKEIDLNPVKGFGSDLYVVDARILL